MSTGPDVTEPSVASTASLRQKCARCNPAVGGSEQAQTSEKTWSEGRARSKKPYVSRYEIMSLENWARTTLGRKIFHNPTDGDEGCWESRQKKCLGLVSENFEEHNEVLEEWRKDLSSQGWTVVSSLWGRHHQGDHNLGEQRMPQLHKIGLHNIEAPMDCHLNQTGIEGSEDLSKVMQRIQDKGWRPPNPNLIYSSPMWRVLETVEHSYGPLDPDWVAKLSRGFSEQRHSNYNDRASSLSELLAFWGEHVKPVNDMTEEDDEWLDLVCMLQLADPTAEEHELANEIKEAMRSMDSFRHLSPNEIDSLRIPVKKLWRESWEDMGDRLRRAMDDVFDDYHHLTESSNGKDPAVDPNTVHQWYFPTHSFVSSVFQQGILAEFPDADRDEVKLKNGELRQIPFAFKLKPGCERMPSKWADDDTERDTRTAMSLNGHLPSDDSKKEHDGSSLEDWM